MAKKQTQARALIDGEAHGVKFKCNQIVEGEAGLVASLEKSGLIDSSTSAVAYAKSLGAEVIQLAEPTPELPLDPPPPEQ